MSLDNKLKLYSWYFNLCSHFEYQHKIGLDTQLKNMVNTKVKKVKKSKKVSRKNLDSFCSQFKKYIVKSCSDPSAKKTKKSINTCRKMI